MINIITNDDDDKDNYLSSICDSQNIEWKNFIRKHSDLKPYSHFDKRVSLQLPSIRQYVENENNIATHSFHPFIHFTKTSSKFKQNNHNIKKVKQREIYYCCHLDRCVYQRYSYILNELYNKRVFELGINDVPIAYRNNLNKNNIDFAKNAFDFISSLNSAFIFVGDFTDFFDNLEHTYLKKKWSSLLGDCVLPNDHYAVYKNITKFSSLDWKNLVECTGHQITEEGLRKKT